MVERDCQKQVVTSAIRPTPVSSACEFPQQLDLIESATPESGEEGSIRRFDGGQRFSDLCAAGLGRREQKGAGVGGVGRAGEQVELDQALNNLRDGHLVGAGVERKFGLRDAEPVIDWISRRRLGVRGNRKQHELAVDEAERLQGKSDSALPAVADAPE